MGFGLTVSVLLHAGLLAWALLNMHATPPLKMPDEIPVEVSIISQIDLETRQKKGDSLSKIEEAAMSTGKAPSPKDAPKPKPVRAVEPPPPAAAEPPPPPPEPVKVEPPPPPEPAKAEPPPPPPDQIAAIIEKAPPPEPEGPSLDEKKKLEEQLAEQQRQEQEEAARKAAAEEAKRKAEAEAKKKAEADAKKKAEELAKKKLAEDKKRKEEADRRKAAELARKSQSFDQQMAELLNKVPDQPSAAQGAEAPPSMPTTAKGPTAGTKTGTDNVNKARAEQMIVAMLNSAFEQCWNKPLAGGGVAAPVVTLRWTLNQDGTLHGEPKVVQTDKSNPLADQAERAALRAVQTCVPFQLPPEQYNMWREITWKFNPNQSL